MLHNEPAWLQHSPSSREEVDIVSLIRAGLEPDAGVIFPMFHSLQDQPPLTSCMCEGNLSNGFIMIQCNAMQVISFKPTQHV